jgi:hypothetical protein
MFQLYFIFILIIYFLIIILLFIYQLYETEDLHKYQRTIKKDGYVVFNENNLNNVLNFLPPNYVFLDYIYQIKGCSLSTFHRDVTSSQYIFNTKYPVYTYITYNNNGALLSICPSSHMTTPFSFNPPVIIKGHKGTSILFNCDVIHAGAINDFGNMRHATQYKICHIDDLEKLSHLKNINITKIGNCNNKNKAYEYLLRKISLFFPFLFNHIFTKLLQDKPEKDSMIEYMINKFYIGDFYNS